VLRRWAVVRILRVSVKFKENAKLSHRKTGSTITKRTLSKEDGVTPP